jgi:hypothetical protein
VREKYGTFTYVSKLGHKARVNLLHKLRYKGVSCQNK